MEVTTFSRKNHAFYFDIMSRLLFQSRQVTRCFSTFSFDSKLLVLESKEPLLDHLNSRGLVASVTSEELRAKLDSSKLSIYCGADPTAKSLHLGNLLPLMVLLHCSVRGHNVIGLVGGATGKVGDPSGRKNERDAMDSRVQLDNTEKIKGQLTRFLQLSKSFVTCTGFPVIESEQSVEDNYSWWKDISMLGFLAQYGRHIRVSSMLARESVKARISSLSGIGFNEFAYQVLQAFDFWHLFKHHKVTLQIGGNDQWGNITAGIDFISRVLGLPVSAYGLTVPLLTTASGEKFGKSAGNAVFIDSPPFELYNYFMKSQDSDVEKLLKIFTFIPLQQISGIMITHSKDPTSRTAQRVLAEQVTDMIHGKGAGHEASVIASILFPLPEVSYPEIKTAEIVDIFRKAKLLKSVKWDDVREKKISSLLHHVLNISNTEAKNLVKNGSVYMGYNRVKVDESVLLTRDILIDQRLLILRIGKSNYHIVEVV